VWDLEFSKEMQDILVKLLIAAFSVALGWGLTIYFQKRRLNNIRNVHLGQAHAAAIRVSEAYTVNEATDMLEILTSAKTFMTTVVELEGRVPHSATGLKFLYEICASIAALKDRTGEDAVKALDELRKAGDRLRQWIERAQPGESKF
jgi:hypothetical protein